MRLPFDAPLAAYEQQAEGFPGGQITERRMALAQWYDFADWPALEEFANAVAGCGAVFRFEAAVEAVIDGDLATLNRLLDEDPALIHTRSTRRTRFDPSHHGATLLHYVAANGVEGYRQRTPPNAVAIARLLLGRGAAPDMLAYLYGGACTTLSLLVSSSHPAVAGVQVELLHTLIDFGAAVEPGGEGPWRSPLFTALAFGYSDAAEALVSRGAVVSDLACAAGLGRMAVLTELLPSARSADRHRALALAAQHGHAQIVAMLLDAGEDPNRFNPEGNHAHSTPLHQAALAGHESVVRLLVARGARTDIQDTIYHAVALAWAVHGGQHQIAAYLRTAGAQT